MKLIAAIALPALLADWPDAARIAVILLLSVGTALLVHRAIFAVLRRLTAATANPIDEDIVARLSNPARLGLVALALSVAARADRWLETAWAFLSPILVPALGGWIAYALVRSLAHALEHRAEMSDDPVAARSRRTRVAILSRTLIFVIVLVTLGLVLINVPGVREVGVTLVASAGLAALAVGAAAQPALKSLIAGLQMALTEPIRIGDLIVIDGHTGRVEDIRMSFVIVRMWDERAVIVPTAHFLDRAFENWSRRNEELTGAVFMHLDPLADVEPIRREFERFVAEQPQWDRRTAKLLVTEARADSMELRLAVSAHTIADLFDLRCAVREHMLAWLRTAMPDALLRRAIAPAPIPTPQ